MSKHSNRWQEWLRPIRTLGIKKEREYFLENFAMLVHSGMGITASLDSIRDDITSRRLKNAIDDIADSVTAGKSLWEGFAETGLFPPHIISLVRIGERSGQLPENLDIVARQQKKERRFRSKLFTAMMYPAFVLGLTLLVGVGVAWFILPNLASVFTGMRMDLPAITQALITLGEFLGQHGEIVIPLFLLAVFTLFFVVFIFPPTKFIGQAILFRLPGTKQLIKETELSRFGYLLGALLGSGVVVTEALDSLASATTFSSYQQLYEHMQEAVGEGYSLEQIFETYDGIDRLIPPPVQGMVAAGEQSGNLPNTLSTIGENFEEKLDNTAKNLTVILEPILLFVVWVGVVAVALAVILPIYSLIGGLNESSPATGGGPPTDSQPAATTSPPESKPSATSTATTTATSSNVATSTNTQEVGTATDNDTLKNRLEVLPTGLGYLNVRSGPSTNRQRIDRVTPGDRYEYLDTEAGWYQIQLTGEQTGWVYGEYVNPLNADG